MTKENLKLIPLFPLNIVVLPYEEVPLHIFEPRYKSMVKSAIDNQSPFGIVLNHKGSFENIGCSLYITKIIKTYDNGEYDLIATGNRRFRILEKEKKNDIWIGQIEYIDDIELDNSKILKKVKENYLELIMKLGKNEDFELYMDKKISYEFLKGIMLPIEFKREMLKINNENERLFYINDLFKRVLSEPIENNFPKKLD